MDRFIIQKSDTPNYWVCTDQKNGVVCKFEAHNFNENQEFTLLEDLKISANEIAAIASEMGDWLRENHYDKLFDV